MSTPIIQPKEKVHKEYVQYENWKEQDEWMDRELNLECDNFLV